MDSLSLGDQHYIDNVLNGSVNRSYKRKENLYQTLSKHQTILELRNCKYRTPARIVANLLETLFSKYPSFRGHWLYIAQHYTPKTINSVISQMLKRCSRDGFKPENPSAYFTYVIRNYRKPRKCFRASNGIGKHKDLKGDGNHGG